MGIFRQFPYSNFHELNLDEILKIVKTSEKEWSDTKEFIENFFDNLDLSEEVMDALKELVAEGVLGFVTPQMYGAKGDGVTDDSDAWQQALDENKVIYAPPATYLLDKSIEIQRQYDRKIICNGALALNGDFPAFILNSLNCEISVQECYAIGSLSYPDDPLQGTFIELSPTSENSCYNKIHITNAHHLKYGIKLVPVSSVHGVQYNEFDFDVITTVENGIYIERPNSGTWVNQNQFHGGRLACENGVYVKGNIYNNDHVNGNNFYNIGFEGCTNPIILDYGMYNRFFNSRMNESLLGQYWIQLGTSAERNFIEWEAIINNDAILDNSTAVFGNQMNGLIRTEDNQQLRCSGSVRGYRILNSESSVLNNVKSFNDSTDISAYKYIDVSAIYKIDCTNNGVVLNLPSIALSLSDCKIKVYVVNRTYGAQINIAGTQYITGAQLTVGYHEFELVPGVGFREIGEA